MAGSTNIADDFRERQFDAAHEKTVAPPWFNHVPPALPGSPPTYPGTLNSLERAEVSRYIANPTSTTLLTLTTRAAIEMATAYQTYYATTAYLAWLASNQASREAQWRLFMGDALVTNKAAISKSADAAGAGSGPPVAVIVPVDNTPD